MTLALAPVLVLALTLALFLPPVLILAMALVKALVPILAVALPVTLGLVQAVAMALSSTLTLLQAPETQGHTRSLIMPLEITTNTGSLRNNIGNFCKLQNLLPEGPGSPPRMKGSVRFSAKHRHGASAFSTTGRKRYGGVDLLPFLKAAPSSLGTMGVGTRNNIVTELGTHREPPTTWIKSQACRMAPRVSISDMDTRDC